MKGFTIFELLVSLTITSILVLAAFYSLKLFKLQSKTIQAAYHQTLDHEQFLTNLKTDFLTAQKVERNHENLIFTFEEKTKNYHFLDSIILLGINDFQFIDTIEIQVKIDEAYFENRFIDTGIIDKCELLFSSHNSTQNLIFTKHYSATDLMNFKQQYEN